VAARDQSQARSLNDEGIYRKLPPVAGPPVIAARALLLALALSQSTDLGTEVARLVAATSAARRLPYRGTLPAKAMPRAEMRAAIDAAVRAGGNDPAVAREGEILRRLGLLPGPDSDKGDDGYAALLGRSYGAATPAPFYDVAAGRLLIPDFVPLADQRLLLAHEIAHAITDQRFGLRRALGLSVDGRRLLGGDAQRARVALVEGDATLAALATIDARETFLGPSALAALLDRMRAATAPGLPPWLATLSRFVHADGLRFTAAVRAGSPWSAVDALWADPPGSTEQVLHPDSYYACDEPIPIGEDAFPSLPGFGRPTGTDVLGELGVRAWLETAVPPELAARAATGWGGDRVAIYTRAAARVDGGADAPAPLLWLTVWDDSAEAADFAEAARAALAATVHAPEVFDAAHAVFSTGSGTSAAMVRRAEAVAVLLDVPDEVLATAEQIVGAGRGRTGATKRAGDATGARPRGNRPRPAAPPGCPRRDRATAPR
jgi:hypothetical protein